MRNLSLAPDRRDGMPSEIEVAGTQGELHLTELREDCYEPVALYDAGNALLKALSGEGVVKRDGGVGFWVDVNSMCSRRATSLVCTVSFRRHAFG